MNKKRWRPLAYLLLILAGCDFTEAPASRQLTQPLDSTAAAANTLPQSQTADVQPSIAEEFRSWSDDTGKFHSEAVFIELRGDLVFVKKRDGAIVGVHMSRLSAADQRYVESHATSRHTLIGKVIGVSDGDTLTLIYGDKRQHRIRLLGIDAPENHQSHGDMSRQELNSRTYGRDVLVEWNDTDTSEFVLGDVFVAHDWINKRLVDGGHAWHLPGDFSSVLADSEAGAREKRVGLWIASDPIPPWDFRKREEAVKVAKPASPPPSYQAPPVRPTVSSSHHDGGFDVPSFSSGESDRVQVRGYFRKNGTYVHPHTRSRPHR
ncbi:MAG TPA: thermonuclease family protein [Pirellulales bacterium]